MGDERDFKDYLSRHMAHLGDAERYRERRKRQLIATYERWLPANRDAELLEIGPGYGQWLEALRKDLGFGRTIAVDISGEVVTFCNRIQPGSTTQVEDTPGFLTQQPGRFARVFAFHVLEHIPRGELPRFVRAMWTALEPGGLCVVEVPNMANGMSGTYLRYADLTHETGFAETSLRQALEAAGFEDVRCFEERVAVRLPQDLLAVAFRGAMRAAQRMVYRGYQLPVPAVLTPALCATARRPLRSAGPPA
jgi:SAM-dependent methyltransferase